MPDSIDLLRRRISREIAARKQAEMILEEKALELFQANQSLQSLNHGLEEEIKSRTLELASSESRYRQLVENAEDIIFNVNYDGYITYVNQQGVKHLGYSLDELLSHHFINFIPESYQDEVMGYYRELRINDLSSDYKEFPLKKKNNDIIWLGQNTSRNITEPGNYYFSAVARDITKRKDAQLALDSARIALEKSEIKYRSIMENMELGLLEVDIRGKIIRVYDRFCAMTGYSAMELIGKDAKKTLLIPEYYPVIDQQDADRLKGESGVYEIQIKKKSGEPIWVLISGAPFYNEKGEIAGSIGVHYNITERKNLESELRMAEQRATKAQQAEKEFLANMSHEIRTPLNAIIGMTHLLNDTALNTEQREFLDVLGSSASILRHLISDILDMSKIDAGAFDMQYSEFDLKVVVNNIFNTFRAKNDNPELDYELLYDGSINHTIVSDRQLINQILINLLSNAEKFTKKGFVKLVVKKLDESIDDYKILFEVIDSGIGISDADIKIIFDQFKQASRKVREVYGGTGLGLAISKKLVNLLGGELGVKSKIERGSVFSFSLKIKKTEVVIPASREELSQENSTVRAHPGLKILVVEDNEMNIKYIQALLNRWKVDLTVVRNGQEAVEAVQEMDFDIVFMDLQMPVMDGFEATRRIRAMEGKKGNVIIVALTASTFLSKKHLALKEGMSDFLSKPFTPDQLAALISKYSTAPPVGQKKGSTSSVSGQINWTYLKEIYGRDIEHATLMFDTYLSIIEDEIAEVRTWDIDELDSIQKKLHKLKPIFSMVGLTKITEDVSSMENLANTGQLDKLALAQAGFIKEVIESKELIKQTKDSLNELL